MTMSPAPGAGPLPPLSTGGAPILPPASDEETTQPVTAPEAGPTEVDELREEIEQTRTELGQTVEALAAKADVKARVHEAADDARAKVREATEDARAKVREATEDAKAKVREATVRAEAALPEGTREVAERAVTTARRYRRPLLAVAGAVVLVVLFVRWRKGRTA